MRERGVGKTLLALRPKAEWFAEPADIDPLSGVTARAFPLRSWPGQ
jgi:hypothetical protein